MCNAFFLAYHSNTQKWNELKNKKTYVHGITPISWTITLLLEIEEHLESFFFIRAL
jgi:hypothetical protein